jgi:putative Holliday junction resolvase
LAASATSRTPESGTLLAFDFGTRRIGVAIGNRVVRVAHPLTTIDAEANARRFAAIAALVDEWRPERLLVGRPVHLDGAAHEMTARSDRFARQLEGRFGIPVTQVDERYTTQAAHAVLGEAGVTGSARRQTRDAVAAQLMLQSYFDRPMSTGSPA